MPSFCTLPKKTWLASLLLILLCAALFGPGLGESTASRQQELRVLLCARDMAEGGDWVIPHFLGQERLRKPPLMYWMVAQAFRLAGSTESLAAARAVSALAATALVLACFLLGRRLLGRRAAFFGALILATSVGILYHGRLAETDMAQALFCTLTIFMLYEALVSGRFAAWWFAGLFGGLGFMIKGPASLAMPAAAALAYLALTKFSRVTAPGRPVFAASRGRMLTGTLLALGLGACIAAPWYVLVAARTATTNSQVSNEMTRLLAESTHAGPMAFYFYTLPIRMGVWGLAVPVAVVAAWRLLRHHRGPRWLLGWLLSTFLILTAISSKQPHYALLLLPSTALLTGWLLSRARFRVRAAQAGVTPARNPRARLARFSSAFARHYLRALLVLLALAGAVALTAWMLKFPLPLPIHVPLVGAGVAALALMILRQRAVLHASLLHLGGVVLGVALGVMSYYQGVERLVDGDSLIPSLLQSHWQQVRRADHVLVSGDHRAPVEWYAHRPCVYVPPLAAGALDQLKPGDVLIATEKKHPLPVRAKDPAPDEFCHLGDVDAAFYAR